MTSGSDFGSDFDTAFVFADPEAEAGVLPRSNKLSHADGDEKGQDGYFEPGHRSDVFRYGGAVRH